MIIQFRKSFASIILFLWFLLNVQSGFSRDIHVSALVEVSGDGSSAAPFKTIQEAAKIAAAGDQVIIHAGTYRETVIPTNSGTIDSRITFMPFNDEVVVIDGSDLVTNWSLYKNEIYRAYFKMTLGAENQLFINGKMGHLARWPNVSEASIDDPFFVHSNYSTAKGGSSATKIIDSALPVKPDNYYKGCTLWGNFGVKWTAFGTTVSASSGTQLTYPSINDAMHVPYAAPYSPMVSTNKELYFLSGKFELLDTYNEWFYRNDSIYLMAKADMDLNTTISAKKRLIVLNLNNKSYITFKNIQVFGGTITMKNANGCTLDGIDAKFITHHSMAGVAAYALRYQQLVNRNGIDFSGNADTIRNCVIKYSAGGGVSVGGKNHVIDNNDIQYCNYVNSYCEGINSTDGASNNIFITRNKVWYAGGPLINCYSAQSNTKGNKVFYNDIAFGEQLGDDRGGVNGSAYEVAYNWVHDIGRGLGSSIVPGLYTDVSSDYSTYHHNVVWNMHPTNTVAHILINDTGNPPNGNQETYIYNNTGYGKGWDQTMTAGLWQTIITDKNNLCNPPANTFVDAAHGDFRLKSTATNAIDKAVVVPGFTDGFVGAKPNLSAYEYGQSDGRSDWKAGLNVTMYYPNFVPTAMVTARGEYLPDQGIAMIHDTKNATKWIDNSTTSWVQFAYNSGQIWNTYQLTSGNDELTKKCDPKDWILMASNDGMVWNNLDTINGNSFATRSSVYTYAFANTKEYKYYKMEISQNNGGANTELSEMQFLYIDREAPTVPSGLAFSANFVLTWKASADNVGVATYEVFNNGISVGKSLINSYTVKGIKPQTEYNFTVKAGDTAENWSDFSATLTTETGVFANYEAENATISGGTLDTNHPGYSGTSFWANVNSVGNSIEFTVNSGAGGNTEITCRYSSGNGTKTMNLYVNDVKIRTVSFPGTANWDTWANKIDNIMLNPGNNTIKYQYDSGNSGVINVDYIQIKPNTTGVSVPETVKLLNIFPNPVKDMLYIENFTARSKIQIYDLNGNVILNQPLIENKLNIRQLSAGIYFIRIEDADHQLQTMKIVKL